MTSPTPPAREHTFITPALLRNLATCLDNGMTPYEVAKELRLYALILANEIPLRAARGDGK